MEFDSLCFFISQIIFVPAFLSTTKKVFKPNFTLKHYIGYTLISPFCIYVVAILCYGVLSLMLPDAKMFNLLASYADLLALALSYIAALIYMFSGEKEDRIMMFFVYICYYMIGMVFNLMYSSPIAMLLFSVLVPIFTAFMMEKYFTLPLAKVSSAKAHFNKALLTLPIIAEAMLVLRFILNIVSLQDESLAKYDYSLSIYCTIFGYIILLLIIICTGMITNNIRQIGIIDEQKEHLIQENARIHKLTFDMLRALVRTIEAKDEYTNGHSSRVAEYTKMIALRMGKDEEEANHIYNVSLLHDIGKIAVPDDIIRKSEKLTNDEFMQIMQHPIRGAEILKDIEEIPDLHIGALYHHERWDGKGYPYGLSKTDIPEISRIISVADAYDAMTSKRSYRDALPMEKVKQELMDGMGTQFDPDIAKLALDMIDGRE